MINAPHDTGVESFAIWGVPVEDTFAFGMGLTLTSASDASRLHAEISLDTEGWKMLSGNTIYLVQGSGTAAESLKTAISSNDFKRYDDSDGIVAVSSLSSCATVKPAAIALAKPGKAFISFIAKDTASENLGQINMILNLLNLKIAAVGLYSPQHIDIAEMAEKMEGGGGISELDLGILVLIKSGYPGFAVKPAVKKFLTESHFTETSLNGLTIYRGSWNIDGQAVPLLVRIDGNRIFAAIAHQQEYAETLITCVK